MSEETVKSCENCAASAVCSYWTKFRPVVDDMVTSVIDEEKLTGDVMEQTDRDAGLLLGRHCEHFYI